MISAKRGFAVVRWVFGAVGADFLRIGFPRQIIGVWQDEGMNRSKIKWLAVAIAVAVLTIVVANVGTKTPASPAQETLLSIAPVSSPQGNASAVVQSRTSSSASITQGKSAPPSQLPTSAAIDETANWQTYRNEKYRFQIRYPTDWNLAANITDPANISYDPLQVVNIVSIRVTGSSQYPQSQTVPVAVAVYNKPSDTSFSSRWLSGADSEELTKITGGIKDALARANTGAKGMISFKESRRANTTRIEMGSVSGGVLFYTGLFADDRTPFIYVAEMHLELDNTARPSDMVYTDIFNQILSTLTVTE